MRIRCLFFLFFTLITGLVFCQDSGCVTNYVIGETNIPVHFQKFNPFAAKVVFINLHDNEQTSIKAAEEYLTACGGGSLVHIFNQQERLINFCFSGKPYTFDPNRIYSEEGRKYTLSKLSADCNDTVQTAVAYLAEQILQCYLNHSKLIVAIHNNTDTLLSILSYKQDQAERKHFGSVFINPEMDPDDFMLTPDSSIFKKIKAKNINVVWENTKLMSNDGSLSIYAGLHRIPYINIEAQHEHAEEQLAMLNALDDIIKYYGRKKPVKKSKKRTHLRTKKAQKRIGKYK